MEETTVEVVETPVEELPIDSGNVLEAIEFLLNIPVIGEYLPIIFGVVTLASAIAAFTPTPTSKWGKLLYSVVVDLPALNIFKAKDKGDEVK